MLHTNLGRAPLALNAAAALVEAAGYTNLEYDLDTGERGSRIANVQGLLREITRRKRSNAGRSSADVPGTWRRMRLQAGSFGARGDSCEDAGRNFAQAPRRRGSARRQQ